MNSVDIQELLRNPPNFQTASEIEDYIQILTVHQNNCEKAQKYMEAESSKTRINELKQHLQQKSKKELHQAHNQQKQEVEKAHLDEFNQFNIFWDQKIQGFNDEAKIVENELITRQDAEFKEASEQLERMVPVKPKESSEVLNLKKIEEHLAKQKNYVEAHKIQFQRIQVEKEEMNQYHNQRNQKIKNQLQQLQQRHQNELNALQQRIKAGLDELYKCRTVDLERLLQKYQNVRNELEAQQKVELLSFEGQLKQKGSASQSKTLKSTSKFK